MKFEKGDIIWANVNERTPDKLRHPEIVWEFRAEVNDFTGIMLTQSAHTKKYENILMSVEHFVTGNEVVFNKTHFVNQLFIKFQNWGALYKGGNLTAEDIQFVISNLTNTDPIEFVEFL